MLSLILSALLASPVFAGFHALIATRASGCCVAWNNDIEPCQASGDLQPCTCTSAIEQDFLSCVECSPEVLSDFNTTDPNAALQVLQQYCDLPPADATLSGSGSSATATKTTSTPPPAKTTSASSSGETCCEAWSIDIQPCQALNDLQLRACSSSAQQDFVSCAECDPTFLSSFNTTDPTVALEILQSYCALPPASATFASSGLGVTSTAQPAVTAPPPAPSPEPTSTSSSDGDCCIAWSNDIDPCTDDLQPCTCTPSTEQDFLSCVECSPDVLSAFNTTDPQVALQILQEYCALPAASATFDSSSSDSSSGVGPFAGLPQALAGFGSGSTGSGNSEPSSNPFGGLPGSSSSGNAALATRPVLSVVAGLASVAIAIACF